MDELDPEQAVPKSRSELSGTICVGTKSCRCPISELATYRQPINELTSPPSFLVDPALSIRQPTGPRVIHTIR